MSRDTNSQLEKLKLLPLDIDKKFDSAYKEKTIKIIYSKVWQN